MSPSLRMRGCIPAVMCRSLAFCATSVCSNGSICLRPGANAGTGRVSERGNDGSTGFARDITPVCSVDVGGGGWFIDVVGVDCDGAGERAIVGGGTDVVDGDVDGADDDDDGVSLGAPGRMMA